MQQQQQLLQQQQQLQLQALQMANAAAASYANDAAFANPPTSVRRRATQSGQTARRERLGGHQLK